MRRSNAAVVLLLLVSLWPAAAAAQQGPVDASRLNLGAPGSVCKGDTGSAPSSPSTCDFYFNTTDGKLYMRWSTGAWVAAGSVSSVGNGTIGSLFSVSWSTATTTPALNLNFATQSANCLLAGPTSGGAAVPTCRTMVLADVPDGLLTDAKVNASGITTRSKLPSAIAYEDESNTFSQPQAFSGAIGSHVIPTVTDTYNVGAYDKLWSQGYISQLNAIVFALQTQTLFGGYSTIGHDAGALDAAVSSGATTVNFGKTMTPGDFVVIRGQDTGGTYTVEYMTVGSNVSGTTYNVTRNLSGAGAKNWAAGMPFLVLGQSGDGRIDMLAYDGKPRTIYSVQGATYNAQTLATIIGNLNGYYGYSSDLFGFCAGDSAAANICIDATNGIRIRSSTTNKIVLAPDGTATFTGTVNVTGGNAATTTYADAAEADAIAAAAADATSKASAAQSAAIAAAASDATTKANTAQSTAISTAASDATTKANAAAAASLDRATFLDSGPGTIKGTMITDLSVTTAKIAANAITAGKISVSSLDAISAALGTITSGSITVVNGGNTIGFTPAGTNAMFAGPTGAPTFYVTPAGVATMVGAVITGPAITMGQPGGGTSGLQFVRTSGTSFGQTGDEFDFRAFSPSSGYQSVGMRNKIVGTTALSGIAESFMSAQGWNSNGTSADDAIVRVVSQGSSSGGIPSGVTMRAGLINLHVTSGAGVSVINDVTTYLDIDSYGVTAPGRVRSNTAFNFSGTDGVTRVCNMTAGVATISGGLVTDCVAADDAADVIAELRAEIAGLRARLDALLVNRGGL